MSNDPFLKYRGIYQSVAHLTMDELLQMLNAKTSKGYDKATADSILSFYNDLKKARLQIRLKDWTYEYNPFVYTHMERQKDNYRARFIPECFLETIELTVNKAYGWFGIGCYGISEEYFHAALSLAFCSNYAEVIFPPASYLAILYLVAGNYGSAIRISAQALEAVHYQADFVGYTSKFKTVILLSLFLVNDHNKINHAVELYKIEKIDTKVLETAFDVLTFMRREDRIEEIGMAVQAFLTPPNG